MKFHKTIVKNQSEKKFRNTSFTSKKKTTLKKKGSIDYNKCDCLLDKKNLIVMKACFSEGKLIKQF